MTVQNKRKNILVLLVTWAALLVAVLYSPIGSPDLYSNQNFFVINRGVDFQGGHIENASNSNFGTDPGTNELNVPDYSSSELKSSTYAVVNSAPNNAISSGANYSVQSQNNQTKTTGSSGMPDGGNTFISSRTTRSNASTASSVTMTNGITTLSTDLATNNTTRQSVGASTSGGTDPGGDPIGPPIPIPDGWGFLLVLALTYGLLKKYKVF